MNKAFNKIWSSPFWLLIILIILFGVNWAASVWHTRLDFTNEKRFTLSNASKQLLKKVKEPIQVDVFLKGITPVASKNYHPAQKIYYRSLKK